MGNDHRKPRRWPRLLVVTLVVAIVGGYGYHGYRIEQDRQKRIKAEQIRRNSEKLRLAKAISDDRLRVKNDQLRIEMLKDGGGDMRAAKALLHSDQAQLEADERAWEAFLRKIQGVSDQSR